MWKTKLGINRLVYIILGDVSGYSIEYDVDQWLPSLSAVIGLVATIVSTSQNDRPIHVPVADEWNHGSSYVRLPKELEDFRMLLDQRSKTRLMSYTNTDIISCISLKVLANREMWDAKVSLVVYTTVEMYELDQLLRQFKWRQRIPLLPQNLKKLHNANLGEFGTNGSSKVAGMGTHPTNDDSDVDANAALNADADGHIALDADADTHATLNVDDWDNADVPRIYGTLWLLAYSDINTTRITVLPRGSLMQPSLVRVSDTRWEAKTTQQSITDDEDDTGNPKDEGHKALVDGVPTTMMMKRSL
ncbi:hypothetical protein J1N35_025618 [Gossypium stocksii]|uniref:Uncharacterized protein n=1 Tax=Gossypium stocksii TaxID=47602 RepID=A0A9D3ZWD5_9ROSI|nr:hypothetical protein J1N35_025618 [Gossypium stocksii]